MNSLSRRGFVQTIAATAASFALRPAEADAPGNWRAGFTTPPEHFGGALSRAFGRLPTGLKGVLYRVGPAQFERAGERLGHWFDGDGMIQSLRIGENGVEHCGRFVDTDKRRAEVSAGRFLYSGYGFAPSGRVPFSHADQLNAANTNILPMGEELWALWEGGSPWRVDADTLKTLGRQRFPGDLDGLVFSAHPKVESGGDIWNFGGFGSRCVIWRLAVDGTVKRAAPLTMPASTLMHDFAVTANYIILLAPPLVEVKRPASSLIDRYDWRPDLPLLAIVIDKNDLTVLRTHELPARFLYHIGNAWEDRSGVIRIDACLARDASFATGAARDLPQGRFSEPPYTHPTLLTLHPDGRAVMEAVDALGEFPRVDLRRVGARTRYTWTVLPRGLARWDWERGREQRFDYGAQYWAEEPVFVPAGPEGPEDRGWIVATRLDMAAAKTELLVFDARDISDGPLTQYTCDYAIPLGFHGAFVKS